LWEIRFEYIPLLLSVYGLILKVVNRW